MRLVGEKAKERERERGEKVQKKRKEEIRV